MENGVVVIAKREDAKRNINGALSTFALFVIFLVLDIIFYVRDKAKWQLVLLIISAVLAGLSTLGLLFAWSNYNYAKKILDTPLITFNVEKSEFVVTDCLLHKEFSIDKFYVIEVKITDKGETYLWYKKDEKKSSVFNGYSYKGREDYINNEREKYKNI